MTERFVDRELVAAGIRANACPFYTAHDAPGLHCMSPSDGVRILEERQIDRGELVVCRGCHAYRPFAVAIDVRGERIAVSDLSLEIFEEIERMESPK